MSSLPRPNRNAAHTTAIGRRLAVSSDTSAAQNPDPTNSPSRQEFSRSHLNEVAMRRKTNAFRASGTVFRFAESRCPKYFHRAGWSSLVARQAHNLKVAGSNPAPATNFLEECCASSFSFVPKRRLPCTNGEARVCSASPKAIQSSSVVERSAVNRLVVGSNPTSGAKLTRQSLR